MNHLVTLLLNGVGGSNRHATTRRFLLRDKHTPILVTYSIKDGGHKTQAVAAGAAFSEDH